MGCVDIGMPEPVADHINIVPSSKKGIPGTLLTPLAYFPVCCLNIASSQTALRNEALNPVFSLSNWNR